MCYQMIPNVTVAAEVAKAADLVVLVLGTDVSVACENRDAVNITFLMDSRQWQLRGHAGHCSDTDCCPT